MQVIERGGYSREEILDVLHGKSNARNVRFRYDLLDKNEFYKKTLNSVEAGEVAMSAFSTIKRTAKFRVKENYVPEYWTTEEETVLKAREYKVRADWTTAGAVFNGVVVDATDVLRLTVPVGTAIPNDGTFGTTSWTAGTPHADWLWWGGTAVYGGSTGLHAWNGSGQAHQIEKKATGSIGIQTKTYPVSVAVGDTVYLSFLFKGVNKGTNDHMLNPNYCYVMYNGQSNESLGSGTVTDLGGGWYRYENSKVVTKAGTVGCLIAWNNTYADGVVAVDNVYLQKNTPPTYYGEWISEEIDLSSPSATYIDSLIHFTKTEQEGSTVLVDSRYTLDGTTWTAWSNEGQTSINGLATGDNLDNFKLQFRVRITRHRIHGMIATLNSLSVDITREIPLYVPETTEINYLQDRIQPFMQVQMKDGNWIEFPLGVFILSTPTRRDEVSGVYREIEAYDGLVVLNEDKFTSRYFISGGKKYTDAVEDILDSAGIRKYNIQESSKTIASAGIEFKIGTSKLEAVNFLLSALNYTPLWVDAVGYYTASVYVSPADRAVDYGYYDDELSVTYNGMEEELDLYNIPNSWVVTQSNPEKTPLVAKKTNADPESQTSTVNVGRNIVDFREVDDIADQTTLNAYVERIAFESSQVFGKLKFKTAVMPFHEYQDVIHVKYDALKIDDKFSETAWTMKLVAGGEMEHEVRKVVKV
jgi:hypothetical protein